MNPPESDQRLMDALLRWLECEEQGEPIEIADLCDGDAAFQGELERLIPLGSLVDRALAQPRTQPSQFELPLEELGGYRLLAPLGAGGGARVFVAEQEGLQRFVALKILDPAVGDAQGIERFKREAKIAAGLDHPNIVPVFAIGEDSGWHFIAMRWLTGPHLGAAAPMEPRAVAKLGVAMAEALDEAHQSGIVHRDVKPTNIILDDGRPFLADFGLARSQTQPSLTRTGVVPGTLPYMSPQLLSEGAAADPGADVYGLGASLYEALSGHPPFEATSTQALIRQILFRDPPPLRLAPPHRDLETIVFRTLEKERDRRIPSARALANELERYLAGQVISSRRASVIDRGARHIKRHPRVALFSAVAIVALIVLGVLFQIRIAADERNTAKTLASVRTATEGWDFALARRLLSTVEPSDDVDVLRRQLDATTELRALLDGVMEYEVHQGAEESRDLVTRLENTDAPGEHLRLAGLGLAAAALIRGDAIAATEHLDGLERRGLSIGVGGEALRAAILQDTTWRAPSEASGRTPDDHVLTAIAYRLLGAPIEERAHELDLGIALESGHPRAMFARALHWSLEGRDDVALGILQALDRPGVAHPGLRRNIARLFLVAGDVEAARLTLNKINTNELGPMEAHLDYFILKHQKREAEARAHLKQALERWGRHPALLVESGREAREDGDDKRACALFEAANEYGTGSVHREDARVELLLMRLREMGFHDPVAIVPVGGFRADLLDIEAQSKLIGANGLTHTAKSHALWIHAWVRRLLTGRSDDPVALDDLRAAIKTDRANLNAATDFVVLTCSRVRPPGSDLKTIANGVRAGPPALDGATRALVAEAHASVKNILACEHQGARRSQQSQLRNARHALVFVAWRGADAELAREAAKTALTHGHPAWKPIYEAVLMWAGE